MHSWIPLFTQTQPHFLPLAGILHDTVLLCVDLHQRKVFVYYLLSESVISPRDALGPGVVGRVLRKVDDTLIVTVEPEFLMLDP